MEIKDYRKKIDEIDEKLVKLFAERMEISEAIGSIKKEKGLAVLDSAREEEKLKLISRLAPEDLKDYTARLYELIFKLSREYQEK